MFPYSFYSHAMEVLDTAGWMKETRKLFDELKSVLIHGTHDIAELLLPVACIGCNYVGSSLCEECLALCSCSPARYNRIERFLQIPLVGYGAEYQGVARDCMLAAKHAGGYDPSKWVEAVGYALAEYVWEYLNAEKTIYVVPAPSGRKRRWNGRYVAGELADQIGYELATIASSLDRHVEVCVIDILTIGWMERSQAGKSRDERGKREQIGVRGTSRIPAQAQVILVDDVVASGATIHKCVEVIRNQGAHVVGVLFACAAQPRRKITEEVYSSL